MKICSRCIAAVLSLSLAMGMTPAAAFAQEEEANVAPEVAVEAAPEAASGETVDSEATDAASQVASEPEAVVEEVPAAESEPAAEEEAASQDAAPESAYDKADFYSPAENDPYVSKSRAAFGPMYLSDEMKYFAKYESSCNYDQGFSYGDGYHAIGYYQFDIRYGLYDFLMACYNYNPTRYSMFAQFEGKKSSMQGTNGNSTLGKKVEAAWHAAYAKAPREFGGLQDAWAYNNYYLPAYNYLLNERGIDLSERADCVKGLCWGMCNLFGSYGWRKFVGGYSDGYYNGVYYSSRYWTGAGINSTMTDKQFVTKLCNYVVNNVAKFYAGQPLYHAGWQNRYRNELADCLEYLEDSEGRLVYTSNGKLRYQNPDGTYAKKAWVTVGGYTYRFNANGYALKGKWWVDGKLYFFNQDYTLHTGWKIWSDGARSYFVPSRGGAAAAGWWTLGGKRYYFNAKRNAAIGKWTLDGKCYYFDSEGVMFTGWKTWSDNTKSYYHPDRAGSACKGWWTIEGKRYYFEPDTRKTLRFKQWIGGELYYFLADSSMHTGWVTWNSDKRKSFFSPAGKGKAAHGWWTIDGKKYYFDSERKMVADTWLTINGKKYYFDAKGVYQPNA